MKSEALLNRGLRHASILAALGLAMAPTMSHAVAIFTETGTGTSGDPLKAQATFGFTTWNFGSGAQNALSITLSNLSASTAYRGNLLTGLFFSIDGDVGPLTTTAVGFDGRATTVRAAANGGAIVESNKDLGPAINSTATDGTFQLNNLYLQADTTANDNQDYSAFEYALATVAYGLGGFNGAAVNADDYGIFATGSNLSQDGLPSVGKMIEGSATFYILRPFGLTSLDQITNVLFAFGSLPDNSLPPAQLPEPESLALFGLGVLGFGLVARRPRDPQRASARVASAGAV